MPDIDLNVLSHTVLWGTFVLTFVCGAFLQRTHFCTMLWASSPSGVLRRNAASVICMMGLRWKSAVRTLNTDGPG